MVRIEYYLKFVKPINKAENHSILDYSCPFKSTVVLAKAAINFGKAALESNNLSSIVIVVVVGLKMLASKSDKNFIASSVDSKANDFVISDKGTC